MRRAIRLFILRRGGCGRRAKSVLAPTASFHQMTSVRLDTQPLDVSVDGSCINQHDKVVRMAGVGVFFGHENRHNVSMPLAGAKQTNARAELEALTRAIEIANQHYPVRPLTVYSDCSYALLEGQRVLDWTLKKNTAYFLKAASTRTNGDILVRLERAVITRKTTLKFVKVKAHSGDVGNEAANDLAQRAARIASAQRKK
jgi:ribonuclease HI